MPKLLKVQLYVYDSTKKSVLNPSSWAASFLLSAPAVVGMGDQQGGICHPDHASIHL